MSKSRAVFRVELQVQPFRVNRDGVQGDATGFIQCYGVRVERRAAVITGINGRHMQFLVVSMVVASAAHLMTLQLSRATLHHELWNDDVVMKMRAQICSI